MLRSLGIIVAIAGLLLTGCSKADEQRAKQKMHEAGQEMKHELKEAGAELKHGVDKAKHEVERGMPDKRR